MVVMKIQWSYIRKAPWSCLKNTEYGENSEIPVLFLFSLLMSYVGYNQWPAPA